MLIEISCRFTSRGEYHVYQRLHAMCDLPRKKETTLSSPTIDELGSRCHNTDGEERWKEVSMAT